MARFSYKVQLQDAFSRKTRREYVIEAADFAAARVISDALLLAIQGLTMGAVNKDSLAEETDVASAVTADANVDEGLALQFGLGAGKLATVNFPMPVKSVFQSDGSLVITDPLVLAFTAPFLAGEVLISDGETATYVNGGSLNK